MNQSRYQKDKTIAEKNRYAARLKAFKRFNNWEKQSMEKPAATTCLTVIFELYDLMPDEAKQRPIDVEGIMKTREGLACLT
jgi:hypothetical protein